MFRSIRLCALVFAGGIAIASFPAAAHSPGQPGAPPGGFRVPFNPVRLAGAGTQRGRPPILADLGLTPGHKSIVFGTSTGRLYVVLYDGSIATGFPIQLPREIVSSPAVGVVTLPGGALQTIIAVGYGSQFAGQDDAGGLRAYKPDGTMLWESLPGPFTGATAPVVAAPAIGDVDGDGKNEVVWTAFDERVHVSDGGTGAEKPGWPYRTYDTIFSSPALFDIDGDGRPEIIVGSDQHLQGPPISTPNGGGLYVLRGSGAIYPGFPKFFDQVISSSPAVGDIDGDGRPEIVFGTGTFWAGAAHRVYALHCDGSTVAGWPVTVQGQVFTSPALADLTGDGIPDVVVTDDNSSPDGLYRVYGFRGNGTQIFSTVVRDYFGANLNAGEPLVADVLGDGLPEVLVPTNGEICVLTSAGVQLTDGGPSTSPSFSFMALNGSVSGSTPNIVVGQLDDGGTTNIIGVDGINSDTSGDGAVWVWQPKSATLPYPWPQFHHDELHLGAVPGSPACRSVLHFYALTPCRLVDTRGTDPTAIGGPAIAANGSRTFTLTGRCGIPTSARALSVNATVTGTGANGSITIYPGAATPVPMVQNLSWRTGRTIAAASVVSLTADGSGTLNVENNCAASVQFILDVNGYFQ